MLAAERARRCGPGQRVFYVTYEGGAAVIRARALSYATGIAIDAFNGRRAPEVLAAHGVDPGEHRPMHQRLKVLDSRDPQARLSFRRASRGYTEGVAGVDRRVAELAEQEGVDPALLVIDYVGAMAHHAAGDAGPCPATVAAAPEQARQRLADRFGCPVWLVHQLSGRQNERGRRGYRLNANAAADCRDWLARVDRALLIGESGGAGLRRVEAAGRGVDCERFAYRRLGNGVARFVEAGAEVVQEESTQEDDEKGPLTLDDIAM